VRLLLMILILAGAFIGVAMFVAPHQPTLRTWYIQNACSYLDHLSQDICAAARRADGEKAASVNPVTPST
jgi:multisubunit Na+/H+ antiporter MnhB subunit